MPQGDKSQQAPPGEFVNADLARDTARFLDELKKRTAGREGFRPSTKK